jgi:hypothetical protein
MRAVMEDVRAVEAQWKPADTQTPNMSQSARATLSCVIAGASTTNVASAIRRSGETFFASTRTPSISERPAMRYLLISMS